MLFPPSQPSFPPARVVITGAGIITALGLDWKSNAQGFRTGRTAFRPVTLFDVSRQRAKQAAEVRLPDEPPATCLSRRQAKRLDRAAKMLLTAAVQAWEQSAWAPDQPIPVVLGTTSGGMSLGEAFYRQAIGSPDSRRNQASRIAHYLCHRQGLNLLEAFRITGPLTIIANACASGANAIGHAWELIRRRQSQRVLTGGYDALSQLVFSGFDSLQALSPSRCRPFDLARDGLALGEGAAVLALESLEQAQARGAAILGEISGYGAATDVHHLTQPHPDGTAACQAMTAACRSAGLGPEQIQYINAHGTGTPLNDSSETAAIQQWAGPHAPALFVSSTKGGIGHLLGAAGAVEAVICLMALREQWLPPTANLEQPDPAVRFQLIRQPASAPLEYALSNSFGFGGANASLIFRRWA